MSKDRETVYEPHPVSPERKAELRAKGYKIIDARFAPKGGKRSEPETDQPGDNIPTAVEALAMADGNFMAFKSAAKKILGDDTPAKKDEIVAALHAKTEA